MPGLYDSLAASLRWGGPRRDTADGAVYETPPPHVPPVPEGCGEERSRDHSHPGVIAAGWLDRAMRNPTLKG